MQFYVVLTPIERCVRLSGARLMDILGSFSLKENK